MKKILTWISLNPAAILFAVNAIIALLISWGTNWSAGTTAIVDGAITAAVTLLTAATTRPVNLQLIVGGATAVVTALAPFGLHLKTDQISSGAVVLSLILAAFFHLAHTPVVAANKNTTGNELQGTSNVKAAPAAAV
jgi:hypothetical protein